MERIPIVTLGESLFVTIQVDIDDRLATTLQDDLMERIVATGARGVLIDISSMEVVVIGMRPVVAITLVELGLSMPGVRTALNVERGMALLDQALTATLHSVGVDGELADGDDAPGSGFRAPA